MKYLILFVAAVCLTLASCQTTVAPEECARNVIANDEELNTCYLRFFNATTMPKTYSVDPFCNSSCPEMLAEVYHCCGQTEPLTWLAAAGATAAPADVIRGACQLVTTDDNQYCGEVFLDDYLDLIATAGSSCFFKNCSDTDCAAAISALGCCAYTAVDVGIISGELIADIIGLLSPCDLQRCAPNPPFGNLTCPTTPPPRSEQCYQDILANDATINECNNKLMNAVNLPGLHSAETFCDTDCPERLARTYHCCNQTESLPWLRQFGVTASPAIAIQAACQQADGFDVKYCLNEFTDDSEAGFSLLVWAAEEACDPSENALGCGSRRCSDAIQRLGCCAHAAIETGQISGNILPPLVRQCGTPACRDIFEIEGICAGGVIISSFSGVALLVLTLFINIAQ